MPSLHRTWIVLPALLLAATTSFAARQVDLDTWMTRELTPYIAETLSSHPRFRNEPVRFVVMQDGNPQPHSSALALALRDQLQDALVDTPGIRVAWQADRNESNRDPGMNGIDCSADEVHYFIGIEIAEARSGQFDVSVRALDLEERSWVSGFGLEWHGLLTSMQYRAWRQFEPDTSFRGDREVPYSKSQTDMLASHLAHELGCTLMRQVSAEYIADANSLPDGDPTAGNILELVGNNLSAYRALQFSNNPADANARVTGKAHRIDEDLYQYWVTVSPITGDADIPTLSASAYIHLPAEFLQAEMAVVPMPAIARSDRSAITSIQLVERRDRPTWFAVQTQTRSDAVLFYLGHQQSNGLVRLSDQQCEKIGRARVSRAGEFLQFNLPVDTIAGGQWIPASDWQATPEEDSFYVVAATDSRAARALATHFDRLPQRCGTSVRPGLEGPALHRWLSEFNDIASHWKTGIDWKVIRVKSVY